jgi:hypothetical protein
MCLSSGLVDWGAIDKTIHKRPGNKKRKKKGRPEELHMAAVEGDARRRGGRFLCRTTDFTVTLIAIRDSLFRLGAQKSCGRGLRLPMSLGCSWHLTSYPKRVTRLTRRRTRTHANLIACLMSTRPQKSFFDQDQTPKVNEITRPACLALC